MTLQNARKRTLKYSTLKRRCSWILVVNWTLVILLLSMKCIHIVCKTENRQTERVSFVFYKLWVLSHMLYLLLLSLTVKSNEGIALHQLYHSDSDRRSIPKCGSSLVKYLNSIKSGKYLIKGYKIMRRKILNTLFGEPVKSWPISHF